VGLIHPEWSEPEMLLFQGIWTTERFPEQPDGHRQSSQNETNEMVGLDLLQQGHRQDGDTQTRFVRTVAEDETLNGFVFRLPPPSPKRISVFPTARYIVDTDKNTRGQSENVKPDS